MRMKVAIVGLAIFAMASARTLNSLNMEFIIEKVNSAQTTWKAGHNFDPDTPLHHIESLMGAMKPDGNIILEKKLYSGVSLPKNFDARTQWPNCPTISHLLDQGNCGSSWAIAAASAFSDRVCIASGGNYTLPLSVEQTLSCCEYCGFGCKGGYATNAWAYFVKEGLVSGGDYASKVGCQPYTIEACEHHTTGPRPQCTDLPKSETPVCQNKCWNSEDSSSFKADLHKAKNFYSFDDMEAIQQDIMKHGSVSTSFTVYADFLTYKSGIYQHVTGEAVGGHAVRVIGWGYDDITPYWLVANSWNSDWGDGGYFKIIRGFDEGSIDTQMAAGLVRL